MDPLREILFRAAARYLSVSPDGLLLPGGPQPAADAKILDHGGARTLYRGRRPLCRSLNGITATRGIACSDCYERKHCTPQVRLDLVIDGRPYRLLLAFSSAKAFLGYLAALSQQRLEVTAVTTRLCVVNRGAWGELHFRHAPSL